MHEKRKQVGISEGIVNFFLPFSKDGQPIEVIATTKFTHVMKEVEPSLWLNMVILHPEALYGAPFSEQGKAEGEEQADGGSRVSIDDGETIANKRFSYSLFSEDDSQIFYMVLEQYYAYYRLMHGALAE